MKLIIRTILTSLLILLSFSGNSQVQIIGLWWPEDTTDVHVLTTVRGDELAGRLLKIESATLGFLLDSGDTLTYSPQEVKSVKIINEKPTPQSNDVICERLLVSPTAFSLKKGENEYRNIMFLYNSYHRGITDKISLGAGLMPIFITHIGWIDAKFSIKLGENLHAGTGGLLGEGFIINMSEAESSDSWNKYWFTGGFGAFTIGSTDRFINLSIAKIILIEDGYKENSPWLYSLGSSFKIGKSKRLFVEAGNYPENPNEWTLGLGITTLYKGNSFDAGLLFFPGQRPRMLPAFAYAKRF